METATTESRPLIERRHAGTYRRAGLSRASRLGPAGHRRSSRHRGARFRRRWVLRDRVGAADARLSRLRGHSPARAPAARTSVCSHARDACAARPARASGPLASSAWGSPSEAVPEVERTLVYLSAALALGLALRRGATAGVLIGLWAGISVVCLYALATRLFPEQLAVFDQIAGYRLSEPVGYWNALGLLAAFGLLLAFGLVARADHSAGEASGCGVRRPARAHLLLHVQPRRLAWPGRGPPRRARARSSPPAAGADRRGDRTVARVCRADRFSIGPADGGRRPHACRRRGGRTCTGGLRRGARALCGRRRLHPRRARITSADRTGRAAGG